MARIAAKSSLIEFSDTCLPYLAPQAVYEELGGRSFKGIDRVVGIFRLLNFRLSDGAFPWMLPMVDAKETRIVDSSGVHRSIAEWEQGVEWSGLGGERAFLTRRSSPPVSSDSSEEEVQLEWGSSEEEDSESEEDSSDTRSSEEEFSSSAESESGGSDHIKRVRYDVDPPPFAPAPWEGGADPPPPRGAPPPARGGEPPSRRSTLLDIPRTSPTQHTSVGHTTRGLSECGSESLASSATSVLASRRVLLAEQPPPEGQQEVELLRSQQELLAAPYYFRKANFSEQSPPLYWREQPSLPPISTHPHRSWMHDVDAWRAGEERLWCSVGEPGDVVLAPRENCGGWSVRELRPAMSPWYDEDSPGPVHGPTRTSLQPSGYSNYPGWLEGSLMVDPPATYAYPPPPPEFSRPEGAFATPQPPPGAQEEAFPSAFPSAHWSSSLPTNPPSWSAAPCPAPTHRAPPAHPGAPPAAPSPCPSGSSLGSWNGAAAAPPYPYDEAVVPVPAPAVPPPHISSSFPRGPRVFGNGRNVGGLQLVEISDPFVGLHGAMGTSNLGLNSSDGTADEAIEDYRLAVRRSTVERSEHKNRSLWAGGAGLSCAGARSCAGAGPPRPRAGAGGGGPLWAGGAGGQPRHRRNAPVESSSYLGGGGHGPYLGGGSYLGGGGLEGLGGGGPGHYAVGGGHSHSGRLIAGGGRAMPVITEIGRPGIMATAGPTAGPELGRHRRMAMPSPRYGGGGDFRRAQTASEYRLAQRTANEQEYRLAQRTGAANEQYRLAQAATEQYRLAQKTADEQYRLAQRTADEQYRLAQSLPSVRRAEAEQERWRGEAPWSSSQEEDGGRPPPEGIRHPQEALFARANNTPLPPRHVSRLPRPPPLHAAFAFSQDVHGIVSRAVNILGEGEPAREAREHGRAGSCTGGPRAPENRHREREPPPTPASSSCTGPPSGGVTVPPRSRGATPGVRIAKGRPSSGRSPSGGRSSTKHRSEGGPGGGIGASKSGGIGGIGASKSPKGGSGIFGGDRGFKKPPKGILKQQSLSRTR